jgi:O-antigen ligase
MHINKFLEQAIFYSFVAWALIIPWSLAGMQIALGLTGVLIIVYALYNRELPVKPHPFFLIWGIYLGVRVLSALISPRPLYSLNSMFHTEWPFIMLPIMTGYQLSATQRKKILDLLIISSSVVAVYAIIQFVTGIDPLSGRELLPLKGAKFPRTTGTYTFFLSFAGNQLMVVFVAVVCFFYAANNRSRIYYVSAILLILFSIISTFARSTWVAFIIVLMIGTMIINKRLFFKTALVTIIAGAILISAVPDIRWRIITIFESSYNVTRLNLWQTALAMVRDNIWLGVGPGLFVENFPHYRIEGFYDATSHAHNDHLHVAAVSGVLGLAAWITMWVMWFFYMFRTFLKREEYNLLGIILAVAAILLAGMFQCYYVDLENLVMWVFLMVMGIQMSLDAVESPKS